ncbi:unnamed protein product, partial [Symbiodinium sp. CCMP2592]
MGQKRQYFVCKCGAWTWADKVHSNPYYCQCGKKWPAPALKQNGSPRPPKSLTFPSAREEERRLKPAVTTIWDQIPEEARSRLTQAGWKGPPKQKDAVESQTDPLLSLLVQRQDELPEDIRTALVEATTVLIHKKIKLLELRLQLQELQETTEKIHEAENAVEKAKLGLTLSDEQQEKLAEYRAKAKKRQRPPGAAGFPPRLARHANTVPTGPAGQPKGAEGAPGRQRSRTPPKNSESQAGEEEKSNKHVLSFTISRGFATEVFNRLKGDLPLPCFENGNVEATPRVEMLHFRRTPDPQIQRHVLGNMAAPYGTPSGHRPSRTRGSAPPVEQAMSLEDAEEAIVAFGGSLAYRLGWDLLDGLQGSGWLDPPLAAAFANDIAAQGAISPANPIHITSANVNDAGLTQLRIEAAKCGIGLLVPANMQGQACGGMITEAMDPHGRLRAALREFRNWIVVGDWNAAPSEFQGTSWAETVGGALLAPEGPTINTGNTLDYALLSRPLVSLTSVKTVWEVPFSPHAAVSFTLNVQHGLVSLPQLAGYQGALRDEVAPADPAFVAPGLGKIGAEPIRSRASPPGWRHDISPTKEGSRGTNNPLQHKPLMQQDWSYPWRGHIAVEATTLHLTKQGIEASSPQDFLCALGAAEDGRSSTLAVVRQLRDEEHQRARKAEADAVAEWLVLGTRRGMRPLFRCLSKAETNVGRPFTEVTAESRPYERLKYWAPGLDGWDVPFLKSLSIEEVHTLADLWREVELEGTLADFVGCWVDDVSADVVHITLFRRLHNALEAEGNEERREEERRLKRAVTTIWDQIPEEDELPEDIRTALVEEAKESLRLQLQELQETTEKIHEVENADVPDTPEPMDVDELFTILGLTLSDEQQEKLAEYRAKAKKRQRPPEVGAPPGLPAFHLGLQGTQPTAQQGANPLPAPAQP